MSELNLIGNARTGRDRLHKDLPAVLRVIRDAGKPVAVDEVLLGLNAAELSGRDWHAIERRCWRLVRTGAVRAVPKKGRGYCFEAVKA